MRNFSMEDSHKVIEEPNTALGSFAKFWGQEKGQFASESCMCDMILPNQLP